MEDEYTTKSITTEYLRKVDEKFNSLVAKKNDILEATVFYQYMLFLFNVNKNSGNVNKRYVQSMMIKLQQLWQNSAYEKQRENLHVFSHETTIKTAVIERFSEQSLMNPIVFARNCIPVSYTHLDVYKRQAFCEDVPKRSFNSLEVPYSMFIYMANEKGEVCLLYTSGTGFRGDKDYGSQKWIEQSLSHGM